MIVQMVDTKRTHLHGSVEALIPVEGDSRYNNLQY